MSGERTIRNLALIGFMGTGKSTVGRIVAEHLGFEFLDTDQLLAERTGRTIAQIFEQAGEPIFRQLENQLTASLATREHLVISTGGGLAINPENVASLKKHALVVCLWAPAELIFERVRHQSHRPLLQLPDPLRKIRELLALREPHYREADVLINTGQRSSRDVAQHILHQFLAVQAR